MTAAPDTMRTSQLPWGKIAWFGLLIVACYAQILSALVRQWSRDPDMGHGFFVPVIAVYRLADADQLLAIQPRPNWWGWPWLWLAESN